ncbi:MAG: 2-hydroxyacyl-CoA dehydratase [Candidatus Brocadiales bacterium]|nr:2-hydroxyacyl-CoA dehydratase [Candidatus Bathyanammoxibius amoris]
MEFAFPDTTTFPALLVPREPSPENSVGITTTVPIEIIFAAGRVPVDLNNIFITDDDPSWLVEKAENAGLPRNNCAWIKGLFSAVKRLNTKKIIGVIEGDCSNTHALMEVLGAEGVDVIPFKYPYGRNRILLRAQLKELARTLVTNMEKAEAVKRELDRVRALVHEIDRLTHEDSKVTGEENHIWNVSTSDMMGNVGLFEEKARAFIEEARGRPPIPHTVRLGYIGIPPICGGIYDFVEGLDVHVVFNEIQRQFSMPYKTDGLVEQYARYTYPYDAQGRLEDIAREVGRRNIHGIIHYVQSFCFRNIFDTVFRKGLDVPILTLECDRPGGVDGQMKTRIEAFVEMLRKKG